MVLGLHFLRIKAVHLLPKRSCFLIQLETFSLEQALLNLHIFHLALKCSLIPSWGKIFFLFCSFTKGAFEISIDRTKIFIIVFSLSKSYQSDFLKLYDVLFEYFRH